jgi:hypothetical protein
MLRSCSIGRCRFDEPVDVCSKDCLFKHQICHCVLHVLLPQFPNQHAVHLVLLTQYYKTNAALPIHIDFAFNRLHVFRSSTCYSRFYDAQYICVIILIYAYIFQRAQIRHNIALLYSCYMPNVASRCRRVATSALRVATSLIDTTVVTPSKGPRNIQHAKIWKLGNLGHLVLQY